MSTDLPSAAAAELLDAFRQHYRSFEEKVTAATGGGMDSTVLWRLGDDLQQFTSLVNEVHISPSALRFS